MKSVQDTGWSGLGELDPALLVDTTEQRELRAVVREFFADQADDARLWPRLTGELGVAGLVIPERYGGSGYTFAELAVVLAEAGRALAAVPLLSSVVLAGYALLLGESERARQRYLPGIADGSTRATVAGFTGVPTVAAQRTAHGWALRGSADFVTDGDAADLFLVRTRDGVFACDASAAGCVRTRRRVLDPTRPQALVEFHDAPATLVDGGAVTSRVVDIGRAAVAAEQVGGSAHALDTTVAYVGARKQFGRAIGSFQAVQHRLAALLVATEAARAASAYATACVASGSANLPVAARAAKVTCAETFLLATEEYVQLHGGIGFTWEHEAHRYVRRARADEVLFGTSADLRMELAELLGLTG